MIPGEIHPWTYECKKLIDHITHTVDLGPSLMVLFQEPPEETFEDGDDALKVPWMQ